jgi:light-regulated signal transduction histidine kinase (bacteriophytochrome)
LGHHYPATDIPQRARQLYVQKRVRVLVDVNYQPVPLVPARLPTTGEELDMSLCSLRSMSPLHLQYLKNMGVTGTLVVSLVRESRLWGLIACHHYSPRKLRQPVCTALELLAEVISTRIAAIEHYVQAQVEVLVKRLELRLIEATSTDGDWRQALFRNPRTLLQPLAATGAALFYDGEVMTAGEVPSTPELRALLQWISGESFESVFSCASVARMNPALASMTPTASGVLAVPLSPSRPDYLIWFRKEQPCEYTWAGDPAKPLLNDDPLTLSPRRSFAAWSEIVRGTAAPWTRPEYVLAKAFGDSLINIILQIHAVRLLIAQHQLELVRSQIVNSKDPVLVADPHGRILFSNQSFLQLLQLRKAIESIDDLAQSFTEPEQIRSILGTLRKQRAPWRGELGLITRDQEPLPVAMRADVLPGEGASILGFIVTLSDLRAKKLLESARRHFESVVLQAQRSETSEDNRTSAQLLREPDEVLRAMIANANVAAMEIADAAGESSVTGLLEELENSTQRAAMLYRQLKPY